MVQGSFAWGEFDIFFMMSFIDLLSFFSSTDNPVVDYEQVQCPTQASSDYSQCQCATK